jgi:hypothetical protein
MFRMTLSVHRPADDTGRRLAAARPQEKPPLHTRASHNNNAFILTLAPALAISQMPDSWQALRSNDSVRLVSGPKTVASLPFHT